MDLTNKLILIMKNNFLFLILLSFSFSVHASDLIKKCEDNNYSACKEQGDIEVEKGKIKEASFYFNKSCHKKNSEGCHFWGIAEYKLGNEKEAIDIWKSACAEEYAYSCLSLGILDEDKGHSEDAIGYYKIACSASSAIACQKLNGLKSKNKKDNKVPPEDDVYELMKLLRVENSLKEFYTGFYQGLISSLAEQNKKVLTDQEKEQLDIVIQKSINTEEPKKIFAGIYEKKYTKEEIKELVEFYRSATGQKFLDGQPDITLEASKELNGWAQKMTEKLGKNLELLDLTNKAENKK